MAKKRLSYPQDRPNSIQDITKAYIQEYFSIEVETVVGDPDDEDGGTMNIGTVYQRDLWIDGEYGSEEDIPDSDI